MPRPVRTNPKIRINLDMPQAVKEQIESIRDATHADSMGEVIRRAAALYGLLLDEKESGSIIVVRTPNGSEKQILLF